jgi:hypothetical protein
VQGITTANLAKHGDVQVCESVPPSVVHPSPNMQVLDADARIFLFEGFLTPGEKL